MVFTRSQQPVPFQTSIKKRLSPVNITSSQQGGFAIAPIVAGVAAVNEVGKKVKPATRLGDWLQNSSMFDGKRDSLPYKAFKGIADTGKHLLGWGYPHGYPHMSANDTITFTPSVKKPRKVKSKKHKKTKSKK